MPYQYLTGSGVGVSAYPAPTAPFFPTSTTSFVPSGSHFTGGQAQLVEDLIRQNVPAHTVAGVIDTMSPSTSASARTDAPPNYDFKSVT